MKLTLGQIEKIKSATKIDLAPEDNNVSPIVSLLFQSRKLGDVLAHLSDQPRNEFLASADSESLTAGWHELIEAVVEFAAAKNHHLAAAMREAIEAELRVIDAGAEQMIQIIKSKTTDEAIGQAAARIGEQMQQQVIKNLTEF